MRTLTALAALLFVAASAQQVPASAHANTSCQLQLLVVDQANVPVPNATVTVYTLDGNQIIHERRILDFTGVLVQVGVLRAKPAAGL